MLDTRERTTLSLSKRISVETQEHVILELELAGMGSRMAAGILDKPLSHQEVMETAAQVVPRLSRLLRGILSRIAPS